MYVYKFNVGDTVRAVMWIEGKEAPFEKGTITKQLPVAVNGVTHSGYTVNYYNKGMDGMVYVYVPEFWLEVWKDKAGTNCVCDTQSVLMLTGCRCGWIQKERAAG